MLFVISIYLVVTFCIGLSLRAYLFKFNQDRNLDAFFSYKVQKKHLYFSLHEIIVIQIFSYATMLPWGILYLIKSFIIKITKKFRRYI